MVRLTAWHQGQPHIAERSCFNLEDLLIRGRPGGGAVAKRGNSAGMRDKAPSGARRARMPRGSGVAHRALGPMRHEDYISGTLNVSTTLPASPTLRA